jgi:HNH endonuclease
MRRRDGSPATRRLSRSAERNGRPIRTARKTRTISPALRRALVVCDRGCRFPGCENHRFVDAHHIRHWARGGRTTLDNLVLLCRRHHRLVHEGGYAIDERMRFYDPWGRHIPSIWRPPSGDTDQLRRSHVFSTIDHNTCASGDGERIDLDLAVDAVIKATGATHR